jgi:hypothetical protein
MLREEANSLEWLGFGGARYRGKTGKQRREAGKTVEGEYVTNLELHAQEFEFLSRGTWSHHGVAGPAPFSSLMTTDMST